ncbi:Crp/Fnr family transcriptional regulator [Rhizobium sp.]|uniref:Crp/Fnr family transcriptional regulator n=1 Tax=Rhizobium sp. TaxID=391 RepID=UPI002AA8CB61
MSSNSAFKPHSEGETKFISSFKSGELNCEPGMTVIAEGTHSPHLYTILEGWGFRYKTLEDGRRQILNYVMPGDMIGLQGAILEHMDHSVDALTAMRLCVFERTRIFSLFEKHAGVAYDITWLASREESILDSHLLSVGRRTALERAAYLMAFLYHRGLRASVVSERRAYLPLTQIMVADTLGLSLVHTNKTLKKLSDMKLIRWKDRGCEVLKPEALTELAKWEPAPAVERPYI